MKKHKYLKANKQMKHPLGEEQERSSSDAENRDL